jgi:hypothetical protein
VLIDGVRQPLLTPSVYRVAPAERRRVAVELDGYARKEQQVTLPPGAPAALRFALERVAGTRARLRVEANVRRAEWMVDDHPAGDGSGRLVVEVPPGPHRVAVHARGYRPQEETVQVPIGVGAAVTLTLRPSGGGGHPTRGQPTHDRDDILGFPGQ